MTETVLGVEGGGTKTAWVLVRANEIVDSGKLPPSNLRLVAAGELRALLSALPREADRIGIFLAGCATAEDRAALRELANELWPAASGIVVGSDREAGLAACLRESDGIVVNAGTGSSVTGRKGENVGFAGGWGHILGDTGGAYFVSIRALRVILRDHDLQRGDGRLGANVLAALGLNDLNELVRWAQTAEKTEIAALAPIVFAAAEGEEPVRRIIRASAAALADFTVAVAARLKMDAPRVCLMGGLFEGQQAYAESFEAILREQMPQVQVEVAATAPEIGAAWLAGSVVPASGLHAESFRTPEACPTAVMVTEENNPRSENLAQLSAREFVELFVAEERAVDRALRQCASELTRAIELTTAALRKGGRLFYVGAGTSGRLGALDAAEIPPTFGAPAEMVQAIIAGGAAALQRSVEGAEDDATAGARAIDSRGIAAIDVVIGISASGTASFVRAALRRAREIGARTILLTCNRVADETVDLIIPLATGPEIIAGSTRLKAGTATKVALNIISTGAMVQLGRVRGNLMIDLQPTNRKLRERATKLVARLARCDEESARARLKQAGWNVRLAAGVPLPAAGADASSPGDGEE